jgi:putative membrane protein
MLNMKKLNKLFMLLGVTSMIALTPMTAYAYEKSETVYTNLKTDGSVSKITVSNHLSNLDKEEIEDETTLSDIMNINGKEKFRLDNNKLIWTDLNNKDIYYQGTTEAATPIEVKVTYYLNGEEIEEKKLEGKSGEVTIKLEFTNTMKNKVNVNGNNTTLYTPFVTTVGTIVKNADDASISNGKVVSTGGKSTMLAVASPGLYESLGLEELKSFNEVEIKYTTKKFKLSNIYIVSTPKLIEDTDLNIFDKLDVIYTDVNKLQENMNTIEEGANKLLDGTKSLDQGTETIATSLKTVKEAVNKLSNGSESLVSGLNQILTELKNAQASINAKQAEINKLQETNKAFMNNYLNEATTLVSKEGYSTVFNQMVYGYIQKTTDDISASSTSEKLLKVYAAYSSLSNAELYGIFGDYTSLAGDILRAAGQYYIFYANYNTINTLAKTLNSLTSELTTALTTATAGATQINSGLSQVKTGVNKIYEGSVKLSNGASELNNGMSTLSEGISTYNKEGINQLSKYADKAKTYTEKLKKLENLSKKYSGYASNNTDSTIFVSVIKK